MAALKYRDEHNKVGFLEKPKGSADYHQVLDFLRGSHIRYAITHDPIIYDSLVKQFWSTASLRASEEGPPAILATIDRTPYTITESLVRSQLQLDDDGGVEDLPIADIYLGMDNLGYPSEGKLTFHKNKFSPQWRFLVHTISHCLSTKSGSWDQFGSQLAIALICLTEGRRYDWSSYIFKGMVNNINNHKKFLMFPRFLQMILEIEPKNTKQYHAFKLTSKMFANIRLNFQGDHMPLLATMLSPAQAAIAGESSGEATPSNPQTLLETLPEPDHSHADESIPSRPTTTTSSASVNEQGPSSDPNIATSSRPYESAPDLFTSTNVEDETMGGSLHTSPPRSTQAPPTGTTSDGAEALDKLTALSSLVSTLVQKVNTQESELKAHKLLFKEVVGKLVKRVKLLEDKLKGRKHEVVMMILTRKELIFHLVPPDEFAGGSDVPVGATTGPSTDPSYKGKSPLLEEDPPVRERTFRQREEDKLGEEAARRMYEEEQDELEREREEMQRKRQQDVLNSAKYYTDSDSTDIMGQVYVNQGLTADLLGPDVNEDNFAERMVALIAKRRRDFAAQRFQDKKNKPMTYAQQKAYMRTFVKNQSSTIYTTGWTMKHMKSFSNDQLKTEFDKIRTAVAELKSLNIKRSLKRPGADLKQASSKKSKPTETPKSSIPDESQQPSAEVPPAATQKPSEFSSQPTIPSAEPRTHSYGTRRKSLGARKKSFTELDLTADDRSFIRVLSANSDDSDDDDDPPIFWPAFAAWEVVPTRLGVVNALYFMDKSSKYFTYLREILYLVDRKDLFKLYGIVVPYYEEHPLAGFDQQQWVIRSWRLFPFSGVHVLETIYGKILPRLDADCLVADSTHMKVVFGVGFKMIAVHLGIVTTSRYVVPTGRVKVPAGRYIKERLKKFGLEDSKPIKTPMSSKTKLTWGEDGESVEDTKYRSMLAPPMDPPKALDGSRRWGSVGCTSCSPRTDLNFKSHVKDNKIDLFVQQYEQFTILEEESIDSGFARFNTIITSLKALDEGKKERIKSIALKAKKESSNDKTSTFGSDDKEYAIAERVTRNVLDAVIQVISLAIVQKHLATKIKRLSLEVLGAIARMTPKTKPITKLVSLLNRKMSANSLREMFNNQKSPNCKIGLGFDSDKASTSGTKTMSFVGSPVEKVMDGSTIKGYGSTLLGSVSRKDSEKGTKHGFSPPMSSRSDFVITRKKLILKSIDESNKPSLKPSLKSGVGYVKTKSRSKTPPPRRNISSQPRYNTPQSRRNSRQPIHQNFYPMNWSN
ncbi:hypothetical protein Tco_1353318 [Tanacetum coccineum]